MQGVASEYTFKDLREYIGRLSKFTKEDLISEHAKYMSQR